MDEAEPSSPPLGARHAHIAKRITSSIFNQNAPRGYDFSYIFTTSTIRYWRIGLRAP
jgi:hypothetical protein